MAYTLLQNVARSLLFNKQKPMIGNLNNTAGYLLILVRGSNVEWKHSVVHRFIWET